MHPAAACCVDSSLQGTWDRHPGVRAISSHGQGPGITVSVPGQEGGATIYRALS